ncbi:thioredoxin family protein [Kaarinaea lacus]
MSHLPLKALLLTAPGCVHCAAVKKILDKFLAEGLIKQLEVVDATRHPNIASQYNVKSVPWLKLGPVELQGAQHEPDLRNWISQIGKPEGITRFLKHLLVEGELNRVIELIRERPEYMNHLLDLVIDEEKDMKIQLGVSAVFEEFEGSSLLQGMVAQLGELSTHENPQIRADVAHYLSLSHSDAALPFLQKLASDSDREVNEIANDILNEPGH